MCPVVNLNICDGLYDKYLSIKPQLDCSQWHEEPEGVIRFRSTDQGPVIGFWQALGYENPLICYVFSDAPEYREMLGVIRDKITDSEREGIDVYNAETGECHPLAFNDADEPVLLAVHARPSSVLESKLLSVFHKHNTDEDEEDGRESRTLTRNGPDRDIQKFDSCDHVFIGPSGMALDDFEATFLHHVEEQEKERRRKMHKARQRRTTKRISNRDSR